MAFNGIGISGSGVTADRMWMNVIAENLANANTEVTPAGGPYREQEVILAPGETSNSFAQTLSAASGSGTENLGVHVAKIVPTSAPFAEAYDPTSPLANAQGYVKEPNVNEVTQMSDMMAASQSYDANVTAMGDEEACDQAALKIGEGI